MAAAEPKGEENEAVGDAEENSPLRPTYTFYIVPHGIFTKDIKVLDVTSALKTAYDGLTDAYAAHVAELANCDGAADKPAYTILRSSIVSQNYTVKDGEGAAVADWTHPWWSTGMATLTFPAGSAYSSHAIESKVLSWARRTERFVKDSVTYSWEMESRIKSNRMKLFKMVGDRRVEVGRYAQPHGYTSGGTLVLDSGELDSLVGVLTCVIVLKKKRQRAVEYGGWS
jgi:hypothetical protein